MNAMKEISPHGSHPHTANESLPLRLQLCHPLTTSKVEVKWIIESPDPPPTAEHTTSNGKKVDPSVPHTHIVFPEVLEGNGGRPSPSCIRNNYVEWNLDMGICLFSRVEEKMDLSGRGWCIITAVHKTHVKRDSFRHAWVYKETWWYRRLLFTTWSLQ